MTGTGAASPKAKQPRGTVIATTTSLAKEAGDVSLAGSNSAYSNGRSGENKHSNGAPLTEGRVCSTQPICHGGG